MERKIALVIGGSGGIGIETAKTFVDKGMTTCVSYYKNETKARKELDKYGVKDPELYKFDMNDDETIDNSIKIILDKHKKIDVIVYCVSTPIINKNFRDLTWEDFQGHVNVQIKGLFTVIKALSGPIYSNNKIKFIVVLTEYVIGKPPSMLSHYITAKYGLMGLVKSLASELVKNNCTFNMVSPGMVKTGLLSNVPPKLVEITAYNNPMKKIAEPTDVAKVISFLASEESDYLNGVNIPVNGGNIFL